MGQQNSTNSQSFDDHVARKLRNKLHRNNGIFSFDLQTWNECVLEACSESQYSIAQKQAASFAKACDILSRYPHVFAYGKTHGDQIIEVRLNICLGICKKYLQRNGNCDDSACQKLHCCSYYLISDCKRGDSCRYSHDLATDHNATLLRFYLLDQLPVSELKALLADRIPQICFNYNGSRSCPAGNGCVRLHICRRFVEDECKDTRCWRSHDVFSEQPKTVLMKCGFNMSLGANEVLAMLRSEIAYIGKYDKQEGSSVNGSRETKGSTMQICSRYNSGVCQSGDQCQRLHLCRHFTLKQCQVSDCGRCHDVMADQPRALLVKHGFNIADSRERILAKLREELSRNAGCNRPNMAKENDGSNAGNQNLPDVCYKYNSKEGCDKGNACRYLHLCKRYLYSDCKVASCRGCHDLTAEQPLAVLTKFGYDVIEEGADSVLAQLRKSMALRHHDKHTQKNENAEADQTLDTCFLYNKSSKSGCGMGEQCPRLHVCRHFLIDQCKFPNCQRSHDITTEHAKRILAGFGLNVVAQGTNFVREKLKSILLEASASAKPSDMKHAVCVNPTAYRQLQQPVRGGETSKPTITRIPETCKLYNVAVGCKKDDCQNLHVCSRYIGGCCKLQTACKRTHNIMSDQPKAVLVSCGFNVAQLSEQQIIEKLREQTKINDNQQQLQQQQMNVKANSEQKQPIAATSKTPFREAPGDDDEDAKICSFHLFGRCKYKHNDCYNYHSPDKLPYQWQWRCSLDDSGDAVSKKWLDFGSKSNAYIESRYCDAAENSTKTKDDMIGGEVVINFESMAFSVFENGKTGEVRRLGTESSASAAQRNRFTTVWVWYWQTSDGLWQAYPEVVGGSSASVDTASNADVATSKEIELKYLANPIARWQFQAGGGSKFLIDLKHMTQTNLNTMEHCKVRRRPELYRPQEKKAPKGSTATATATDGVETVRYPNYWDVDAMKDESVDYVLVPVPNFGSTANEYKIVADRFGETMPGVELKSVQRIQNRDMWESFDAFRTRINRKRSTPATQLLLFHGTRKQYIEAICQQGFDWRMCGASVGTAWGKGSYFARDASYSKSYTDCHTMFLVQVVVGDYTRGNSTMVRPPPKDPSKPFQDLYDSVVNDVNAPSIFVTFERHQSYPEYLIEY